MTRIIKLFLTTFILWNFDLTTANNHQFQQQQHHIDNKDIDVNRDKDVLQNGNKINNNNNNNNDFMELTDDVVLLNNLTDDRIIEENNLLQQLNRYNHKNQIRLDNKNTSKKHRNKKVRRRKGHKKKIKRIKMQEEDTLDLIMKSEEEKQRQQINSHLTTSPNKLLSSESAQKKTIIIPATSTINFKNDNVYDKSMQMIVQKDVESIKNNNNHKNNDEYEIADNQMMKIEKQQQRKHSEKRKIQLMENEERKRQREAFREQLKQEKLLRKRLKKLNKDATLAKSLTAANSLKIDSELPQNIIIGDLSCMKEDFKPAPPISHAEIKYLRNDMYGIENSFLEAEYHCYAGFKLKLQQANGNNTNLICKQFRWIGKRPECVKVKAKMEKNLCKKDHHCDQVCFMKNSTEVCSCYKGFKIVDKQCIDINECIENEDACEYGCSNTVGSFTCKCPKGLRTTDNNKCMDINECLLRNGHGLCQDTCINTWSSYRCTCEHLPGTKLSNDGHSCEDVDECTVSNGGCSHTCLNTLGRAFCVCPDGYMLDDDWKTCVDIDECANQNAIKLEMRCNGGCLNTPGSYKCINDDEIGADQPLNKNDVDDNDTLCPTGYYFNATMGDCQDMNECHVNNGECQHHCINIDGSFYCSCKYGFKLDTDKHACMVLNSSLNLSDIACPPLFPPRHGYLECSRPIDEVSDGPNGGRHRITNRPGSQCILKCPTGYRLEGKFSKICGNSGDWIGDGNGTCIRYPTPKLMCLEKMLVELHPNETSQTNVKIKRPKTDVNWERDVIAEPFWTKKDILLLKVGLTSITYTAKHPISKLTTSCNFSINVLVGEAPHVDFCPDTQIYTIEGRHQSVKATWVEPIFSDNVSVDTITKSNSPGTDFGAGNHQIVYEAKDAAGWKSRCSFKIVVNVNKRKDIQHFQLPILYNRFYF